ncbi:MAG TPA: cation:dicarboxylase symporter family transporter [Rhodothermia bacterium]
MSVFHLVRRFLDTFRRRYLTISSLAALVLGSCVGLFDYFQESPSFSVFAELFDPIISHWVSVLKVVVIPLVVAYIVVAVVSHRSAKDSGKLGGLTLLIHTAIAVGGLALSLLAAKFLIPLSDSNVEALRPHLTQLVIPDIGAGSPVEFWDGVIAQVWASPLTAIRKGQILPMLFWSLGLALILRLLDAGIRLKLIGFFKTVVDIGQFIVGALLVFMPIVVFGLIYILVAKLGLEVLSAVAFFIVAVCGLATLAMVLLYLLMPIAANIGIREMAAAMLPTQIVAIGSRSSLACLPTLMEAAEQKLKLDSAVTEFVLPLSVSSFKLSRVVTTPFKFFFLAHLFGLDLDPAVATVFIAAEFALSYGSPGLPSGSLLVMLPVYIAAGIPVEGYALLLAVDAIPDIFKTLLNVTEDLALVSIIHRIMGRTMHTGNQPFQTLAPDTGQP